MEKIKYIEWINWRVKPEQFVEVVSHDTEAMKFFKNLEEVKILAGRLSQYGDHTVDFRLNYYYNRELSDIELQDVELGYPAHWNNIENLTEELISALSQTFTKVQNEVFYASLKEYVVSGKAEAALNDFYGYGSGRYEGD